MGKTLQDRLESWPKSFINDIDLANFLGKTDDARHSIIKRALKSGVLIRLKKGLYIIASKTKQLLPNEFELALLIYGPSFISLESALSYHGWIPEAVYSITCVSTKRAQEFTTPLGVFTYKHVPDEKFYIGVDRIENESGIFFMASPWRAIADLIYTRRKMWQSISELAADFRIDKDDIYGSDIDQLKMLSYNYPGPRVRKLLKKLLKEIVQNKREYS